MGKGQSYLKRSTLKVVKHVNFQVWSTMDGHCLMLETRENTFLDLRE